MSKFNFNKYQPLSIRLWHWLNAIAILGLLATVLLRKTFLSWRTNSVLIQDKLAETGVTITADVAKQISVAIRNPLWDWHIYLGFLLAALLVFRFLIFFFNKNKNSLIYNINNLLNIKTIASGEKKKAFHYSIVKISYALFYLVTFFMVVTGFTLNFKNDLGLSKDLASLVKEFHELTMWFFVVFILGHIIGVIWSENNGSNGIVSEMINGGDVTKK